MPAKSANLKSQSLAQVIALTNNLTFEVVAVSALREPKEKVRTFSARAIAQARAMHQEFGQMVPLLVSKDNIIIAGQEMYLAAIEDERTHLNVIRANHVDDIARRVLTIAHARIYDHSSFDPTAFRIDLISLDKENLSYDLGDMIAHNTAELDIILNPGSLKSAAEVTDDCPAPPEPTEVVTELGDIWIAGKHRFICGDALDPSTYAALLGEQKLRASISDAPYGIKIAGNVSGLGKHKHADFKMGVGEHTPQEFEDFLAKALANVSGYLREGALSYNFMDRRKLVELSNAATKAGYSVLDLAVWNKLAGGMGGLYRSQHELCFVFKWGNAPHINNVQLGKFGRSRSNVWDFPGYSQFGKGRNEALRDHPTVKPVPLLAEIIKDCTARGDGVIDFFAGSGSTIIAAEKTGRIGFGIELDSKYVDVIVRRWETLTGRDVVHAVTGKTFAEMRYARLPASKPASSALPVNPGSKSPVKLRKRPVAPAMEVSHG